MKGPVRGNVLISSAGRRVELVRSFREALGALGLPGRIVATDASRLSAAAHEADDWFLVPRCDDAAFIPAMLELCARHDITLIVPTIDPELPVYAARRDEFVAEGTTVAVSTSETVAIGFDKVRTHRWLVEHGFPTVRQASRQEVRDDPSGWDGPLVAKPRFGSASIGVSRVPDVAALARIADDSPDLVVQSEAAGVEHTVDLLVARDGTVVDAVPRRRIEVRAGEVSKAVTVRHGALERLARDLGRSLPGAYGALNLQVFVDGDDLTVIELNPRFGGGFPLSSRAGARFPQWMLEDLFGLPPAPRAAWQEGIVMLRYDASVFVDAAEVGL